MPRTDQASATASSSCGSRNVRGHRLHLVLPSERQLAGGRPDRALIFGIDHDAVEGGWCCAIGARRRAVGRSYDQFATVADAHGECDEVVPRGATGVAVSRDGAAAIIADVWMTTQCSGGHR